MPVWADLNLNEGGRESVAVAPNITDDLSDIPGILRSAITESGHGCQPNWLMASRSVDREVGADFASSCSRRGGVPKELLELRRFGWSLSDDTYLRGCGRRIRRGAVVAAHEILDTTAYCHRKWLCPTCGYVAARRSSRTLEGMLIRWSREGGSVGFLTLTQRHDAHDALPDLWDRIENGWGAAVRGSGWRADRRVYGICGYARITEVIHHPVTGWNVHLHVLLFFDRALSDNTLGPLKDSIVARFLHGIGNSGGHAEANGQHLCWMQPRTEPRFATYCFKGTTVRRSPDGSRTPMAILSDVKSTGHGHPLWTDFTAAVSERRRMQLATSRGIARMRRSDPDIWC